MTEKVKRGGGRPAIGSRRIFITVTESTHTQLEHLAVLTGSNLQSVAREVLTLGLAATHMKEESRG